MKNSITRNPYYQRRPRLNSSLTWLCDGSTLSGHRLWEAEAHVVVLCLSEGHREQPVQAFRLPAGDLHRHGHRHFPRRPYRPHLCDGPRPQRRAVLHAAASAEEHVQDKQTGRQHRGSAGPGTRQVGTTNARAGDQTSIHLLHRLKRSHPIEYWKKWIIFRCQITLSRKVNLSACQLIIIWREPIMQLAWCELKTLVNFCLR